MAVSCALFGKAPTRRDFLAVNTPRRFLTVWEEWLQNAVASSREALKAGWNDAFLTAPIWRFWLGADIAGTAVIGALMPSVDGVGRYFPLTLAACGEEQHTFAPPEVDAQDFWFAEVERSLLWMLEQHDHAALLAGFEALPAPKTLSRNRALGGVCAGPDGVTYLAPQSRSFEQCFALTREADPERTFSSSSFWWTLGGEGYPPRAFASLRLPPATLFVPMLTGDFEVGTSGHG